MRIFVTGGTGFLGAHLLPVLAQRGHQVAALSRSAKLPGVSVIQGDLQNVAAWQSRLREFAPEAAIHLAWEGLPDYGLPLCVKNLHQGIQLYQSLLETGCQKIVTTGTCWEYGALTGRVSVGDLPGKMNVFAATKQSLRLIGHAMADVTGAAFIWARVFFVYGPGQRPSSLIPSLIHQWHEGKKPDIRNPSAAQDFIYVRDVAAALALLAETKSAPSVVNVGSGKASYVADVAQLATQVLQEGRVSSFSFREVPAGEGAFWADPSEMKSLGWKPEYDLFSGIQETVAGIRR